MNTPGNLRTPSETPGSLNPAARVRRPVRTLLAHLSVVLIGARCAAGATVTLTNSDALNTSSFAAGLGVTNWDSGLPPAAGDDYVVPGGRTLRTPTNGAPPAAYTFGGNSLLLAGSLLMKGSNRVTISSLTLSNGAVQNGDPGVTPKITRIAGAINVLTNAALRPTDTNRTLEVTATLSGTGNLTVSDRGVVKLSGSHSYSGPMTTTGTLLDMDGTVSLRPSALIVGKDSSTVSGQTNFYGGGTNLVRAGGSLNVGYGSGGDLRVGWRTSSNITNNPTGLLDVSAQSSFDANVGNFIIGYSQAASTGTPASALGLVYLATNNTIVATNIIMGDTIEGTHPSQQRLVLGSGSNYIDTPVMVIGARKQRVALTLPAGGSLLLTNSASGRTDLTVGGNNISTSANPTDLADLTGGPLIASLGNLIVGQKSGANTGGVQATLTLATNSANNVDVNDVTLGSMAGNVSGTTSASGTLNLNGGSFRVNNSITLASYDNSGLGAANGTLNLNAGALSVGGDILDGNGNATLNVNGGLLDLQPAGDGSPGSVNVDTLVVNGTITNAGSITATDVRGSGSVVNQTGVTVVSGTLDPGTSTTAGTLKLGSLTLSPAATLRFNLTNSTTVGSGVNDLLDITGDVDLGNASLNIVQLSSGLAVGTYRLANYTGEALNTLLLPNVGRYTLSLTTDTGTSPKHLNLDVTGNPFSLLWGGELGSPWDINTTQNWTNQLNNPDFFFDNDTVLFNDVSLNPYVTLDVTVQPGNVVFSNNVNAYTLAGSGKITGPTGLAKQGTGTLTLSTSNDFTGPVTLNGGLLIAGNGGALGATNSGTTIAGGATLDVNDQNFGSEVFHVQGAGYDGNGAIVNNDLANLNGARNATRCVVLDGNTTVGGLNRWDVRGTGAASSAFVQGGSYSLTKTGGSTLALTAGCDVNMGDLVISQGNVAFEGASTINTNFDVSVGSDATFTLYQLATPMGRNVILADRSTLHSSTGTTAQNQVSGSITLTGVSRLSAASGQSLTLTGPVTGPGQFVKVQSGTVILVSPANDWFGGTTISNGVLQVGNGLLNASLPAAAAVITNYGTLMYNVAAATTVTTAHEITGTGGVTKRGDGILALTISNSFTGPVNTGTGDPLVGGVIRFLNSAGFGDPSVSKTVSVIRAEIRLEGGVPIPPSLYFQTSAQTNISGGGFGLVAFRNVAGTNTISNSIELIGGAGSSEYSSDAGLLTFDGPIFLGNTSSRSAIYSGLGNGVVNGQLSDQVTSALTVEKRGPGTWTLTAANVYTGSTLVGGGTLIISGSIGGSGVTVSSGTLAGAGTINAPVTVQTTGTLSPGASPDTLTINDNLTLQGTTLMEVGRNGSRLTNDLVTGVGICTYGGLLVVTNVGSSPLQPGDSFQLFAASSRNGSFTNIVYPTGYNWTNSLSPDGRVGVESVAAPSTPPNFPPGAIATLPDGNISLTATGAVGTPFRLWASTNVMLTPITDTWTLLSNSTITVSPFTLTDLTATNCPQRFYRFSAP